MIPRELLTTAPSPLVVNADDFGRSSLINECIIQAHQKGIVTSTSLMTDRDAFAEAVALANGRVVLEASGGVTLGSIADIAATGVDYISSGALTHSAPNFDVALDIEA